MSNDMKRELLTWLHYFLIMLIAATVAGFFYEKSMQVPTDANVGSGGGDIAMNFHGLLQSSGEIITAGGWASLWG
jgi:hypothetical protein